MIAIEEEVLLQLMLIVCFIQGFVAMHLCQVLLEKIHLVL